MAVRFVNWSQTVTASPAAFHEPASEDEVRAILARARAAGQRVKAVGGGHSWSEIAVTDGVMLDLRRMSRLLRFDAGARRVTVEAGMRLRELNGILRRAGFSLSILGSITEQAVAGAIATGTHGSSLVHGNLSSLVCGIRLITAGGDVVDIGEEDERLAGARVHLGALGVVTRVTLRVEPAFLLEEQAAAVTLDEVLGRLPELARSAEYVKIWWLPHAGAAQIYRCRRWEGPGRATFSPLGRRLDEAVVNRYLFAGALRLGGMAPRLIPGLNRVVARAYFRPRRTTGCAADVLTVAMPPRHRETEASVPLGQAAAALGRLDELVRRQRLRVNLPIEVRFVRGDDGWLSPAAGRDSCQIGAYMAASADLAGYFAGFHAIMRELQGRPHWGKELSVTTEDVTRLWPEAGRFRALARALDPGGMLRNRLLDAVLG